MCEMTQFAEEHHWCGRSQEDCRSTEDQPDSKKPDVIIYSQSNMYCVKAVL